MAKSKDLSNLIKQYIEPMAPIHIYPGEDEIYALLMNGDALLKGNITAKEY